MKKESKGNDTLKCWNAAMIDRVKKRKQGKGQAYIEQVEIYRHVPDVLYINQLWYLPLSTVQHY